jgi:hypothetical protein
VYFSVEILFYREEIHLKRADVVGTKVKGRGRKKTGCGSTSQSPKSVTIGEPYPSDYSSAILTHTNSLER